MSLFHPAPTSYAPTYEPRVDAPEHYRTIEALGVWLILFLLMGAAIDGLAILSTLAHAQLLERMRDGAAVSQEQQDLDNGRQGLIALAQIGAFVTTAVVFVTWLWRAYRNLAAFSRWTPEFDSGWTIGCWFVPFINLVRPYQIVRETWWVSGNPELADEVAAGYSPSGNALLGVWWGAYIVMNLLGRGANRMASNAHNLSDQINADSIGMIADGEGIIAAILAVAVVGAISSRQLAAARARRLV